MRGMHTQVQAESVTHADGLVRVATRLEALGGEVEDTRALLAALQGLLPHYLALFCVMGGCKSCMSCDKSMCSCVNGMPQLVNAPLHAHGPAAACSKHLGKTMAFVIHHDHDVTVP